TIYQYVMTANNECVILLIPRATRSTLFPYTTLFRSLILRRYISLRLIVVVVGDKKLDPVIWEEVAKLSVKLSSECLIVAHHQCRALFLINNISNGTCFTGTGYCK